MDEGTILEKSGPPGTKAVFRLAGDRWLVEGLDARALGAWAEPAGERDLEDVPDVTIRVKRDAGAVGPGASSEGAYRLSAEDFRAEVASDLATITVWGDPERSKGQGLSLAGSVRASVRLCALLRCVTDARGVALHASGVEWDGRAFIFAGPADAGKTTAAGAASRSLGAGVFADDLVMLRREKDAPVWHASGLPWEAGEKMRRRARPVRASALVTIRPGKEFTLAPLSGARAAAAALASPPEVLGVETGRLILAAARLADELPVYRAALPAGDEAVARLLREIAGQAARRPTGDGPGRGEQR
ncbi:MAG: hypothetical protein ACYSU0_22005 [Planctomycetota bacterium]|jgi:hypothetical protein